MVNQVLSSRPANFMFAASSSATRPGSSTRAVTKRMRSAGALERFDLLLGQKPFQPVAGDGAGDRLLVEDEVTELALLQEGLELVVGQALAVRREQNRLDEQERERGRGDIADREISLPRLHVNVSRARRRARSRREIRRGRTMPTPPRRGVRCSRETVTDAPSAPVRDVFFALPMISRAESASRREMRADRVLSRSMAPQPSNRAAPPPEANENARFCGLSTESTGRFWAATPH